MNLFCCYMKQFGTSECIDGIYGNTELYLVRTLLAVINTQIYLGNETLALINIVSYLFKRRHAYIPTNNFGTLMRRQFIIEFKITCYLSYFSIYNSWYIVLLYRNYSHPKFTILQVCTTCWERIIYSIDGESEDSEDLIPKLVRNCSLSYYLNSVISRIISELWIRQLFSNEDCSKFEKYEIINIMDIF